MCDAILCSHRVMSQTPGRCRSGWQTRRSCYTLWSKIETSAPAALRLRITWPTSSIWHSACSPRVYSRSWHTPCLPSLASTPVSVACYRYSLCLSVRCNPVLKQA